MINHTHLIAVPARSRWNGRSSRRLSLVQRRPARVGNGRPIPGRGLPLISRIKDWSTWLAGEPDDNAMMAIRGATATGRACGSEEFMLRIESYTGLRLRPQKPGPKPRPTKAAQVEELRLPPGW
jgi:hypothetical protein